MSMPSSRRSLTFSRILLLVSAVLLTRIWSAFPSGTIARASIDSHKVKKEKNGLRDKTWGRLAGAGDKSAADKGKKLIAVKSLKAKSAKAAVKSTKASVKSGKA